jgi:Probable zinc-ribbon domain
MSGAIVLRCADCDQDFTFPPGEQKFFEERGFQTPKRCHACRGRRRTEKQQRADIGTIKREIVFDVPPGGEGPHLSVRTVTEQKPKLVIGARAAELGAQVVELLGGGQKNG